MSAKKLILIMICAFFMLSAPAIALSAENEPTQENPIHNDESLLDSLNKIDIESQQAEALGVPEMENSIPDSAKEILGDITVMESLDFQGKLSKIGSAIIESIGSILHGGLRSTASILIVILLCSAASSIYDGGSVPDFIPLGGVIAISTISIGEAKSLLGLGSQSINALSDFSKILLPSMAAASTASGAITSASAKYAATALFMDVLLTAAKDIIFPLIYAYIAITIAHAALDNSSLAGAAKLIKWLLSSLITILIIAFTSYLGITGVISGTSDAVATRVAKTTLGAALPVVGGIISDAASTVLAGASILKNAIGIFGMLVIICMCLTPFLTLGIQYLLYKATSGLASAVCDSRLGGLLNSIGSAFGFMLAIVGSSALMLFFSIISSIKAVNGL